MLENFRHGQEMTNKLSVMQINFVYNRLMYTFDEYCILRHIASIKIVCVFPLIIFMKQKQYYPRINRKIVSEITRFVRFLLKSEFLTLIKNEKTLIMDFQCLYRFIRAFNDADIVLNC